MRVMLNLVSESSMHESMNPAHDSDDGSVVKSDVYVRRTTQNTCIHNSQLTIGNGLVDSMHDATEKKHMIVSAKSQNNMSSNSANMSSALTQTNLNKLPSLSTGSFFLRKLDK